MENNKDDAGSEIAPVNVTDVSEVSLVDSTVSLTTDGNPIERMSPEVQGDLANIAALFKQQGVEAPVDVDPEEVQIPMKTPEPVTMKSAKPEQPEPQPALPSAEQQLAQSVRDFAEREAQQQQSEGRSIG